MKTTFFTFCVVSLALAGNPLSAAEPASTKAAVPKIQFETNFFDFGKVTSSEKLVGSFKFKNVGKADLHLEAPQASCDCTEAKISPDIVPPGQSGEVSYSIKMDHAVNGQRFIKIHSDDPENPDLELTIQLDYTPLFETTPPTLHIILGPGRDEVQQTFIVNRTDEKALGIDRLSTSQEWISAELDATYDPTTTAQNHPESTARVIVTVKRPKNPPTFFKEKIELWNGQQSDHSAKIVELTGQIMGDITIDPPRLEWAFADLGDDIKQYSEMALSRHITLRAAFGKTVEFKKISTDIKGMTAKVVPKDTRSFDLIVKFEQLPHNLIDGKVILETSLESMPKLEVPLHISAVP